MQKVRILEWLLARLGDTMLRRAPIGRKTEISECSTQQRRLRLRIEINDYYSLERKQSKKNCLKEEKSETKVNDNYVRDRMREIRISVVQNNLEVLTLTCYRLFSAQTLNQILVVARRYDGGTVRGSMTVVSAGRRRPVLGPNPNLTY